MKTRDKLVEYNKIIYYCRVMNSGFRLFIILLCLVSNFSEYFLFKKYNYLQLNLFYKQKKKIDKS